ncbi:AAA family ATPase [Aureispira anguillae]|uniref:AAA family ATPase n=1 Tax=Aureispira anguillae TaxID=2864201 RepID=A0A915YEF6_9BACT|nr:AAA family ATPase [Aureispira anguillae]BDS11615.1 AAA family ATPase [Aureispira anguillae]
MKIDKLYLKNFRNIEETHYEFPTNFTGIIGMNGSGKSTILHALRVAAGAYFMGIPNSLAKNRHISKDEVRMTNNKIELFHHPVIVEAEGQFPENNAPITWRRRILKEGGSNTSSVEDVGAIRNLGSVKYNKMKREGTDELDLPVIAYFGTNRVFGSARKRQKARTGRQIFKEGYYDWLDMRSSTYQYAQWLTSYDALVKNGKEYSESKETFFQTIKTACPYVTDVDFISDRLWLRTQMKSQISDLLPLELKSDGIITFVQMIAELAYRCIILNGYLKEKAILQSKGIVLIDEIDLHLHPKWQEHVVKDLKKAFPNIQFIVTTHSPIIVQSLKANELINLDSIADVNPSDLTLGEVVTHIMGKDSEHSESSNQQEQLSKEYLTLLKHHSLDAISEHLNQIEFKIIDPSVRAFLKMQRLEKRSNK